MRKEELMLDLIAMELREFGEALKRGYQFYVQCGPHYSFFKTDEEADEAFNAWEDAEEVGPIEQLMKERIDLLHSIFRFEGEKRYDC